MFLFEVIQIYFEYTSADTLLLNIAHKNILISEPITGIDGAGVKLQPPSN